MTACHDHNLREALAQTRPFGIRVRLRKSDPFRNLVGDDWQKEHWFATRPDREQALEQMSSRYIYFLPGDRPTLDFKSVDHEAR